MNSRSERRDPGLPEALTITGDLGIEDARAIIVRVCGRAHEHLAAAFWIGFILPLRPSERALVPVADIREFVRVHSSPIAGGGANNCCQPGRRR